jgi:hypothetical protein
VPLPLGDRRNLDEQPLSGDILEARLENAELHSTAGVNQHLGQASCPPGPDLSPHALGEVGNAGPNGSPPALVAETVLRRVEGERCDVVRVNRVADEAAGRVGIQTDHEEEREMVRVPECLEALGPDLVVGGAVHENHDEQHEVTRYSSRLVVVDVDRGLLADFCVDRGQARAFDNNMVVLTPLLYADEVNIVGGRVDHGPECHGVGNLTMEPDVLVRRERPGQLGADEADDVAEHRDEDHAAVQGEDETGTTGRPHGPLEGVQTSEFGVGCLSADEHGGLAGAGGRAIPDCAIRSRRRRSGDRKKGR